ncbi:hypothetical protein ACRAWG_28680 [Methylobacterium sp. P31]
MDLLDLLDEEMSLGRTTIAVHEAGDGRSMSLLGKRVILVASSEV